MEIKVIRLIYGDSFTRGMLSVDGRPKGFTLEDVVRKAGAAKVPGQTAIPAGRYKLVTTFSPKFGRGVLMLENVPGFERIYFHGGNTAKDTEGCILVARNAVAPGQIQGTIEAELYSEVKAELDLGHLVFCDVVDTWPFYGVK